jgi:adhesin/invasin
MSILLFQIWGRGRLVALGAAIALASLAGCGETSISVPLTAARVEAAAGNALSGPAGGVLPDPIEVRVFGSDDQPLPGATVNFSVAAGGSVDPLSAITDGDGIARTRWTLGSAAGVAALTASVGTGVSTTISATVTAARAATVGAAAGENQTAPAGAAVSIAPSVRVADAFGNLVEGVTVTFSVLSGGGRVTGGQGTTNAQGIATVGSWTLGPLMGTQTLAARVEENGVSDNPIIFTATATMPTGAEMVATAGNNQEAPVGRLVPITPTVVVRNAAGDGVPGLVVTFTVSSGGGSVVGSRQVTDETGTAMVGGWFLGPLPGPNTITASSPGLGSVMFSAAAVGGTPVSMVAVSQTTQTAPVSTNVADPPVVVVRDAQGIPVPGVEVTFSVTAGGGTVVGSPAQTDANGVAALGSWELGAVVGTNTVTATATGLPSVTFNATATAGTAASVVAVAGDNQTGLLGTSVATPPTVRVTDAAGNPVIGGTVTFAVVSGGGVATGLNQLTNSQGQAAVGSWVLGGRAPNTLRATVTGSDITGNPVTFTAQSASEIAVTGAPAGPISLGDDFTITAQLWDEDEDAVALLGVQLTIGIASGGGTLNGTLTRVTDASGAVSFTLINVTGVAGDRKFTITGPGLQSATTATITFN